MASGNGGESTWLLRLVLSSEGVGGPGCNAGVVCCPLFTGDRAEEAVNARVGGVSMLLSCWLRWWLWEPLIHPRPDAGSGLILVIGCGFTPLSLAAGPSVDAGLGDGAIDSPSNADL